MPHAANATTLVALAAAALVAAGTAGCRIEARESKSMLERQAEQRARLHERHAERLAEEARARAAARSGADAPEGDGFAWPDPGAERDIAVLRVRDRGEIRIALYPELAPATVARFVELAQQGFFDGTTFHRVVPGFVIQGGDPLSKNPDPRDDGQGGSGQLLPDELGPVPQERGVVSMANRGRVGTADSQFFITLADRRELDGRYAAFGRVVAGMGVVDAVAAVPVDVYGRLGATDRPLADVIVERVRIERGVPAAIAAADAATQQAAETTAPAAGADRAAPSS
jgi:cyclophilin family peptidyl-prolyl cis-trans isomerase